MIVFILKHKHEPWRVLGRLMCDRAVHRDVGGPLFSGPGSVWFVALDSGGREAVGFCSLSDRGSTVWYDCAYVVPQCRGAGVFSAVAQQRDEFSARLSKPVKTSVRPERWHHYAERGFAREYERDGWVYGVRS